MALISVASESTARTNTPLPGHLHDLVLNSPDVEDFLYELAQASARSFSEPGEETFCSITLIRQRKSPTVVSSSPEAKAVGGLECQFSSTPGMAAAATGEPAHLPDAQRDSDWPDYADAVTAQGVRSVISVPFRLEGETKAALVLYARRPHQFDDHALEHAKEFAAQASPAVRLAVQLANYRDTVANLRAALETRTVIDMAVGIIMAQNRCSQEDAFDILKAASSTRNSKLHDVAASVVNALGHGPARTHYDE